ncbi:unnamed protein product, partial [Owenia fusiformis]
FVDFNIHTFLSFLLISYEIGFNTMQNFEIIDFYRPRDNQKTLYVTNLSGFADEPDAQDSLTTVFSKFGLLNNVHVLTSELTGDGDAKQFYAFINFYSGKCATQAKKQLNGKLMMRDTLMKVNFASNRKKTDETTGLYITKCHELANHYLGFNGWSAEIISMKEYKNDDCDTEGSAESLKEDASIESVSYICITKIDIRNQEVHSEGIGMWTEKYTKTELSSKLVALCKVKKIAFQRAMENAFSKIVLIVFGDGRVLVEIDTTKQDVLMQQNEVEKEELLKINELEDNPIAETDQEQDESQWDESAWRQLGDVPDG